MSTLVTHDRTRQATDLRADACTGADERPRGGSRQEFDRFGCPAAIRPQPHNASPIRRRGTSRDPAASAPAAKRQQLGGALAVTVGLPFAAPPR